MKGLLRRGTQVAGVLMLAALAACETPPTGIAPPVDGGGDISGPGRGMGGIPGEVDASGVTDGAPDAGDAVVDGAAVDVAPVDQGVDTGAPPPTDAMPPPSVDAMPPPPPGSMCREEPLREARMLTFAGGPNFGSGAGVGLCGYPNDQLPKGRFYGAVDSALFDNAGACGACMRVQNAEGTLSAEVQIIDLVDPMTPGKDPSISADLAVQRIFSPEGNPVVKFQFVPCREHVAGNIRTAFDTTTTTGSSLLVMNHLTPLARIEINTTAGWKPLNRTHFNRWAIPFAVDAKANDMRFFDASDRQANASGVAFASTLQDTGTQFLDCAAKAKTP